jgi:hypothetical protein
MKLIQLTGKIGDISEDYDNFVLNRIIAKRYINIAFGRLD